jgi:glycosyltransferase involved in cell wall biosynthesis
MNVPERRILYVINHAAFFVSHRLVLALEARRRGFSVSLLSGQAGSATMERGAESILTNAGVAHMRVPFTSAGVNPVRELLALALMVRYVVRLHPDLIHCASPKGLLYGGLVARLCRTPALVLAVSGMGFLHTDTGKRSLSRRVVSAVYRRLAHFAYGHPNISVIVQNRDDRAQLVEAGPVPDAVVCLIPGSGVALDDYADAHHTCKDQIVLLPARMLYDKGVAEFVQAVRDVKTALPGWRFVLAGAADYNNPSSVSADQLGQWVKEGVVEWKGHVDDMRTMYARAAIVCLPSYREGMPKALLEAAAASCAVITTDAVGCREAVLPGESGLLVPVRDVPSLAHALQTLCGDRMLRERFGARGRQLAAERFGIDAVLTQTMTIYEKLLRHA